jgi:hypothetical protein
MIDAGPALRKALAGSAGRAGSAGTFLGSAPVAELRMSHGNIVTAPAGSQGGCALLTGAPQLVDGGASAALALG